jgi:transposase
MKQCIGCDAHKKYSVFAEVGENGERNGVIRVDHNDGCLTRYLKTLPEGSDIAVETTGSWYWMIDEMERLGLNPCLAHAGKAKKMFGQTNKTDKLDAYGLATLLKSGTLPKVWIPPQDVRDRRELPRTRMALTQVRTKIKNRVHATLSKYNIKIEEASDLFGKRGRSNLNERLKELPEETERSTREELLFLDQVEEHIQTLETRIREIVKETEEIKLLTTSPGMGPILSVVVDFEIGDVSRFPDSSRLASYSGTVPRIHSSGGKTYFGRVNSDVNHYLKWAFIEAASCIVLHKDRMGDCHVTRLYNRVKATKNHPKAVVAVARHLAEASFYILKNKEPYKEPRNNRSIHPGVSATLA